ncbi:hypothetical protein [Bradyrhizobium sp. dw_411]|uniref:hypothetical protein n=1 Tax=Bradyrhizobium sp. dw_411 TaxID=2720082 RepID=UPI001BCF9360|nr:hypothetical protein [Bradyrhizobium sp. dw_411]
MNSPISVDMHRSRDVALQRAPSITFDTNVCNVIHHPEKWPQKVAPEHARAIRRAIVEGRIRAFLSEASIFVEALEFVDKLNYLAVVMTPKERPKPQRPAIDRFKDIESIGARLLHAEMIGSETFIEGFAWAEDREFSVTERQARYAHFCRDLDGREALVRTGKALEAELPQKFGVTPVSGPLTWTRSFLRAWEAVPDERRKGLRKKWGRLFSEWADGSIVASHFAYGNDIFCTIDEGRRGGAASLLHRGGRAALAEANIIVMDPKDLVQQYGL